MSARFDILQHMRRGPYRDCTDEEWERVLLRVEILVTVFQARRWDFTFKDVTPYHDLIEQVGTRGRVLTFTKEYPKVQIDGLTFHGGIGPSGAYPVTDTLWGGGLTRVLRLARADAEPCLRLIALSVDELFALFPPTEKDEAR